VAAAALSAKMVYNDWQFPQPAWRQPNLAANERGELLPDDNPQIRSARRFSNLRMALLPYLYQAYSDYHRKGIAPVRPLVADWPEDAATWHLNDQWMLGADLLVAPLAEPLVTLNDKSAFTIHLAAYGDHPRLCQLCEDDGTTFDHENGKWATLTLKPDGTVDRPGHGQPLRYNVARLAESPEALLKKLLNTAE
jgi:hypothetical protein